MYGTPLTLLCIVIFLGLSYGRSTNDRYTLSGSVPENVRQRAGEVFHRRQRKQTRYTIFAVESPAGYADINFESTIKFIKTSLDLISEFHHYPEIKFFVDRKHRVPQLAEELPYRYSLFSIDLTRNRSQYNYERISEFIRSSSEFTHSETMEIYVKAASGKIITLDVDASETVENIKSKIHDSEGIPPNMQRLQFDGNVLQNERRLHDYNIRQESTLDLIHGIDIGIRITPALVVNLRAVPSDTIASVKQKLLDVGGVTIDKIKLNYAGQELQNNRSLNDYDVRNGSVIEATLNHTSST